jgi:hypothetical protein
MGTLTKITTRQRQIIDMMLKQTVEGMWFSTYKNRRKICDKLEIEEITLKQHLQRMRNNSIIMRPEEIPKGAYVVNMVRYFKLI